MDANLILNPGSASKKYALYINGREAWQAHLEKEGGNFIVSHSLNGQTETAVLATADYENSAVYLLRFLQNKQLISSPADIRAVGVRVVAPGEYFLATKIIDAKYLARLTQARAETPLHSSATLEEIRRFQELLPAARFIGVSDSAFHATLPPVAKYYALPETARKAGIRRFGYHGISVSWSLKELRAMLAGHLPVRTIVCHLGSGASVSAVRDGASIDTSMGFTPLEGLVMGTRVGDIDAGATVELGRTLHLEPEALEKYLNTACGLLGLSGRTADVRELLSQEAAGDVAAGLALDIFAYRVRKYIGAYTAALSGADALVFTGTISERSPVMRRRICAGLERLGFVLDTDKNSRTVSRRDFIHTVVSPVKLAVIPANEMGEIAADIQPLCL